MPQFFFNKIVFIDTLLNVIALFGIVCYYHSDDTQCYVIANVHIVSGKRSYSENFSYVLFLPILIIFNSFIKCIGSTISLFILLESSFALLISLNLQVTH